MNEEKPENFQLAKLAPLADRMKALKKGKLAFKINRRIVEIDLTQPFGGGVPHSLAAVLHDSAGKYVMILRRQAYNDYLDALTLSPDGYEVRVGKFEAPNFEDRWIQPEYNGFPLRRRGIATHALKYVEALYAAIYKKNRFKTIETQRRSTALFLASRGHVPKKNNPLTLPQIRGHEEELPLPVFFGPKRISRPVTLEELEKNHVVMVADKKGKQKWHLVPKRREE